MKLNGETIELFKQAAIKVCEDVDEKELKGFFDQMSFDEKKNWLENEIQKSFYKILIENGSV